ncbi:MAG TPA: zinc-binding dehydrogenase, partial [Actinophytocola sp.]|uniref:zinc-binding dehydrogenase n=1 Tax=Actinophytocola sp. TaxID=1872138 RepID=UPI002DF9D85D|nr:zinc-binding dehydrogenase [Actinophytocola sp.]
MPDAQAATLPTAGLTALRSLAVGGLVLGKRVLVTGATGGVGRFAVQLARVAGARVSALVRDAAAAGDLLRRLGAREVAEAFDGDYDLIIDGVGGTVFGQAVEHLAAWGIVVNIATGSPDETVTFRAARFDRSPGARIHTLNLTDELAAHRPADDLERLATLVAEGELDGQVELERPGVTRGRRWMPCCCGRLAARSCCMWTRAGSGSGRSGPAAPGRRRCRARCPAGWRRRRGSPWSA